MKTIHVAKPFNLTVSHDDSLHFEPGHHEVEDSVADHWYVQQHLAHADPALGTEDYAKALRAKADSAFVATRDAAEQYEALAKQADEAEDAAGMELSEPAHYRLARPAAEPAADAEAEAEAEAEAATKTE